MFVVALTGAGISASAGIPTFQEREEDIRPYLTREFSNGNPEKVAAILAEMNAICTDAEPTTAHKALAKEEIPIVTQNIDGLHQRAGSKTVIELHGNLERDDVVLYGDQIHDWWKAIDLIGQATDLIVIGCSLDAKPAGELPIMA